MGLIYEPRGRAREYSPLALNHYKSCDHGCLYCYGVRCTFNKEFNTDPEIKIGILERLEKELKTHKGKKDQVLLSFIGDPYCNAELENKITPTVLSMVHEAGFPIAILTKGGERALRDLRLFKALGNKFKFGTTLTFIDKNLTDEWEPGAATYQQRKKAIMKIKEAGIKTWASFEPVIDPEQSLRIMVDVSPFVDEFRIGKINQYKGLDKKVDWSKFLSSALRILRAEKKQIYVKIDLREAAPDIQLKENEKNYDLFLVK